MSETSNLPAVAILAGGLSRRMGSDKASFKLEGQTLLDRTIATAHAAFSPTSLLVPGEAAPSPRARIGHPDDSASALHVLVVGRDGPDDARATFCPDDEPGHGPLGGLATALRRFETVLLLGCDLPLLTAGALRWLWSAAQDYPESDGLVLRRDARLEPLFAVYRRTCLPLAEARLSQGERSMHGLVEAGRFVLVDVPPALAAQLANVNTPAEWEAATAGSRGPRGSEAAGALADRTSRPS